MPEGINNWTLLSWTVPVKEYTEPVPIFSWVYKSLLLKLSNPTGKLIKKYDPVGINTLLTNYMIAKILENDGWFVVRPGISTSVITPDAV